MKVAAKMSERFPGVTGIGEFKYLKRLTAAYLRGVEDGKQMAFTMRQGDNYRVLGRITVRKRGKTNGKMRAQAL